MSLLQISAGNIADRFNRRVLVILGCAFHLVAMALIPAAGNFWQLLVLCACLGIGGAVAVPAASVLVISQGRRFGMGVAMAAFNVAMSLGLSIGPILAGVIADLFSVSSTFYFAAAVVLVGTIAFSRLTR